MNFFEEAREFVRNILVWVYFLVGFSFLFFLLPLDHSFSVIIFEIIKHDLLPSGVELMVTNPLSAFLAQIQISFLLAFLATLPIFLYKMMKYFLPALYEKEKKIIFWILFPSISLFFAGCTFAYFFLIPITFEVLYPYAITIGAVSFFSVGEFISSVFGFMMAVGVMFLLPIFMAFLNFLGVVDRDFWMSKWRYALALFLLFSAIITPDGTGITMVILVVPLMVLYGSGMIISRR